MAEHPQSITLEDAKRAFSEINHAKDGEGVKPAEEFIGIVHALSGGNREKMTRHIADILGEERAHDLLGDNGTSGAIGELLGHMIAIREKKGSSGAISSLCSGLSRYPERGPESNGKPTREQVQAILYLFFDSGKGSGA